MLKLMLKDQATFLSLRVMVRFNFYMLWCIQSEDNTQTNYFKDLKQELSKSGELWFCQAHAGNTFDLEFGQRST